MAPASKRPAQKSGATAAGKSSGGIAVPLLIMLVALAVLIAGGVFVAHLINKPAAKPDPPDEQCVATVGEDSGSLTLEQSRYAAIIVAESIRRGLPPRAATIALATAMQESGLRNLDYGDRDSVGLFQQRPSQGWGTEKQLQDPWFASGQFYAALVHVKNWRTGDINDVAQSVQHSGVPDGYRKHVAVATVISTALTGHAQEAISCIDRGTAAGSPANLSSLLTKAFGSQASVRTSGRSVTVTADDQDTLWSAAQLAMMSTGVTGVHAVSVQTRSWTDDGSQLATWTTAKSPVSGVVITLR